MSLLWNDFLILQTLVGYCFVVANVSIGLYHIRDLNTMKGDLSFVKTHKLFGRIESIFYYIIAFQCVLMVVMSYGFGPLFEISFYNMSTNFGQHNLLAGPISFCLFTTKYIIATFKKDTIYKYGQYIGPLGFIGWSLGHWTSLILYYFAMIPNTTEIPLAIIPNQFWVAAFLPIPIGLCMFLIVLAKTGKFSKETRFSTHQIAFILHGITFGYEKASKDLLGTPALFKYVIPKTYIFLEKMMSGMGLDLKKLEKMNLNDAMEEFMKKAAEIKMAEKIKVKWEDAETFTVESVNCSTAKVRSVMSKEELTNAVCPWAIIAASIAGRITGKELDIEASEFNEIGAKTRLKIKE